MFNKEIVLDNLINYLYENNYLDVVKDLIDNHEEIIKSID